MGGSGSTVRKVSFGLDEEDRVRVLRGVRMTDDLVDQLKKAKAYRGETNLSPAPDSLPSLQSSSRSTSVPTSSNGKAGADGNWGPFPGGSKQPAYAEEELYRRYEREQTIIQEELARITMREREAAQNRYSAAILREKNCTNQERHRADQLPADLDEWAKELKHKEEELKKLDSFHKEQLASIEKKNLEIYRLTAEQFHTAATNAELRVKKRSYDPVCMDLQSNILKCYSENQQERLNCSDLAKEYRHCVNEAQKFSEIYAAQIA
ncbi:MICOS complex subunit MIC25 [Gastrophryne carolinensis]